MPDEVCNADEVSRLGLTIEDAGTMQSDQHREEEVGPQRVCAGDHIADIDLTAAKPSGRVSL